MWRTPTPVDQSAACRPLRLVLYRLRTLGAARDRRHSRDDRRFCNLHRGLFYENTLIAFVNDGWEGNETEIRSQQNYFMNTHVEHKFPPPPEHKRSSSCCHPSAAASSRTPASQSPW